MIVVNDQHLAGKGFLHNRVDTKAPPCQSTISRTDRRFAEMQSQGREVTREEVHAQIGRRDARDMGRKDAPLKPAPDAYVLDTTALDKDASIAAAIEIVASAVRETR